MSSGQLRDVCKSRPLIKRMGTKVLIVEDRDVRHNPLRIVLERELPKEAFHFVRVSTIAAALEVLGQDWDVILMDYHMGEPATAEDGTQVLDGAGLIIHRRKLEAGSPGKKRAQIIGVAGTRESGEILIAAGCDLNCCGDGASKRRVLKALREWV